MLLGHITHEEARARYTSRFTHTEREKQPDGSFKMVTYYPECPANNKELDEIFQFAADWNQVLDAMWRTVGEQCPAHCRTVDASYAHVTEAEPEPETLAVEEPLVVKGKRPFEAQLLPGKRLWFVPSIYLI